MIDNGFLLCSPDPVRLLLTFGASTSIQEKTHENTALHWAIQAKNSTALTLLLKRNASLDILNNEGETAFSLIKKLSNNKSDWIGGLAMDCVKEQTEPKKTGRWEDLKQNKVNRNCSPLNYETQFGFNTIPS